MTKTDEVIAALMPFCRKAYRDGWHGEFQGAWERFGEESMAAFYAVSEQEPSPACVKFVEDFGQMRRQCWERGKCAGSMPAGTG